MLFDRFINRGNKYLIVLEFNATGNSYDVSIKSDDYHSAVESYNAVFENYTFPTYAEACAKFTDVFRWNHGLYPALPNMYDFLESHQIKSARKEGVGA